MPNISDTLMHKKFTEALTKCESNLGSLTDWEYKFVLDIRERFDNREHEVDLGMSAWNPSSNQWNTLLGIANKL